MPYASHTFPGTADQVANIRRFTRKMLGEVPDADDVVQIVSELTANAILHSESGEPDGTLTVHVAEFRDRWRVRVDDQGGPQVPRVLEADPAQDEAGRGLALVTALSETWGVLGDHYGRAVWAEMRKGEPGPPRSWHK